MIVFVVNGQPIAKKRPRFAVRNGQGRAYNCQETEEGRLLWEIRNQYKGAPLDGPLHVSFRFYFEPPKSAAKKQREAMLAQRVMHMKKPDGSNLNKFCEDVMNGYVWIDDCQIVTSTIEKYYDEKPRTEIYVVPYEKTEGTKEMFDVIRNQIIDAQGLRGAVQIALAGGFDEATAAKEPVTPEDF